jgi:hypothetical protein
MISCKCFAKPAWLKTGKNRFGTVLKSRYEKGTLLQRKVFNIVRVKGDSLLASEQNKNYHSFMSIKGALRCCFVSTGFTDVRFVALIH